MLVHKITPDAIIPTRGSTHAAGHDLYSTQTISIQPQERKSVLTGIKIQCPDGTYGQIASRSGLALKHGIDALAGVIDSDYRGEVKILLGNNGTQTFHIKPGDRIAQIIFIKTNDEPMQEGQLSKTTRDTKGFGSTGVSQPNPTAKVVETPVSEAETLGKPTSEVDTLDNPIDHKVQPKT